MKNKLFSPITLALILLTSCQPIDTVTTPVEMKTPTPASKHALVLEKATETKNGYILLGRFYSVDLPNGVLASGDAGNVIITDADGKNISWSFPKDSLSLTGETGNFPWSYEIPGKEHAWPLTITFNSIRADVADAQAEFDFDTGPNPQGGQKWVVDQDITVAGYALHVDYILHTGKGYSLKFANDPDIASIGMEIVNADNPGSLSLGGGGGSGSDGITARIDYDGKIPFGRMTIRLSGLIVYLQGKWQLQWQPGITP